MVDFFRHEKSTLEGAQSSSLDQAKIRLVTAAGIFFLGYLAISLRLADLTLLRTKPETGATNLEVQTAPLRANILDRNGEVIATSLEMTSVYADTSLITDAPKLAEKIITIVPGLNKQEVSEKLSSGKKFIWIARNVTPKQEYALNALGEPGLQFQKEKKRIYPSAQLASHVIGYTDVDGQGIAGIEKSFQNQLIENDIPLQLSLDMRLQHIMHKELSESVKKFRAKAGVGMIMDVNTGEILAMVSLPDFDPQNPGIAKDDARFNRASLGVFEMGSTFKLFSIAAALDSGLVNFNTQFDATQPIHAGRFTIADYHAKKRVLTVPEIFIYSSNIGTAKMADALGTDDLKNFYESLGFFSSAPIELPEKGSPLYPKPWRELNTLTTSFGHGIAVSPVHLMRAGAALVNGGMLITPTLVKSDNGSMSAATRVISPVTSEKIRKLMELVVAAGTGNNARVEGYNVGGKTGTAEKISAYGGYNQNALLSSFLGAFPIQNPRYEVLVIIDEPQPTKETHGYATGGWTAAPAVAHIIEQMGPLYGIMPEKDHKPSLIREMSAYLKEVKEGGSLASIGSDR